VWLPFVTFLLGYIPEALLQQSFLSLPETARSNLVGCLEGAVSVCFSGMTMALGPFDGVFHELTLRICRFVSVVARGLPECLPQVISVLKLLISAPWQIASNYAFLFDSIVLLVRRYDCHGLLIRPLLLLLQFTQHSARCFATAVVMELFKGDFDRHRAVSLSSVDFLNELTGILLRSDSRVSIYKEMLRGLRDVAGHFGDAEFAARLDRRLVSAINIADTIEKMRAARLSDDDRARYFLEIAHQYGSYPSMKIRWLKELVRVNAQACSNASAFVAQLHICALIATVVEHRQCARAAPDRQLNLIICQPMPTGPGAAILGHEFAFIPSVLEETAVDFGNLIEDPNFIEAHFTQESLRAELREAVAIGSAAQLFYSLRPLLSFQLRLAAAQGDYREMSELCGRLATLYKDLSGSGTATHCTNINFFLDGGNRIYVVDAGAEARFAKHVADADIVTVAHVDSHSGDLELELEHAHCWDLFRTVPQPADFEMDGEGIPTVEVRQYKTSHPLPYVLLSAEVVQEQTLRVSLADYAQMETERIAGLVKQCTAEIEAVFGCSAAGPLLECWQPQLEQGIERVTAVLDLVFHANTSLVVQYKQLSAAGAAEVVGGLTGVIVPPIRRLFTVYRAALQAFNKIEIYAPVERAFKEFTEMFQLGALEIEPYSRQVDPLRAPLPYE
jgi:hypothetical protein